jgi:hypothetical protein
MRKNISGEAKRRFIKSHVCEGQFFTVTFRKKDKSLRTLTGRRGVKKHTKGVGMAYDPDERGLITVWENRKDSKGADNYRMVSLDKVTKLKVNHQEFEFED